MSTTTTQPFNIGDEVCVAWAHSYSEKTVTCPVCFGKRHVLLTLGSGEQQPIECDYCRLGYDGPRGVVIERGPASGVRTEIVTGLSLSGDKWCIQTNNGHHDASKVFSNTYDAEVRAKELHLDADRQAQAMFESNLKSKKSRHSYNAGYHRNQIKKLERELAYHRSKLTAPAMEVDDA